MDGIRINNLHSQSDFGLCINSRNIGLPKKQTIRETVPFMNGYYDFTALNGSPAWGERSVTYAFDIIADTPEELENDVERVLDWLCNVHDEDIYDDTMPAYHWHGSYENCTPTWDDTGMKCTLSVVFVVYPFKIANEPTTLKLASGTHTVVNHGMDVAPIVKSSTAAAIQIGTYVSSIPANTDYKLEIDLKRGTNTVIISGDSEVTLSYYKEVM